MRPDHQRLGERRTTLLVPEAIIPRPRGQRWRWGQLIGILMLGMLGGVALAWSLGLIHSRFEQGQAVPAARFSTPAPRSPYPSELPDLSSGSARSPVPIPSPAASPDVVPGTSPRMRVEQQPNDVFAPRRSTVSMARADEPSTPARPKPAHATPVETQERPLIAHRRPVPRVAGSPSVAAQSARSLVGPLANLFIGSDYPVASRRAAEQGDVTVKLVIGVDGRVSRCAILAADASPALQTATCRILIDRARFAAATDPFGAPVIGTAIQHIAWRLR